MFELTIKTDNAAFTDDPPAEVARIVHKVADRLINGALEGQCLDANGNPVGEFLLTLPAEVH